MTRLRYRLGPNAVRVAAASALVLAAIILAVVISSSGGTYEMKASFADVRGLIPGAPVRAGAVQIGTVESVKLVGDRPVASMKINNDFRMHQGATADIQLFSNAGAVNRTIELTQGDPTMPELKAGSTMQGPQVDQPVNFDDATEVLDTPTRNNLRQLLGGLDAALKGRGGDFDRTLRHSSAALNETSNLLAQVNSDGAALRTVVDQGSKVTSALAASPGDIASAADSTASLLRVTSRRQAEIARSVALLGPALVKGRTSLTQLAAAAPRLRTLVAELAPVANELGPFAKVLKPALTASGPFLFQTRRLVEEGPGDLTAFKPIIASAHNVTGNLGDLLSKVEPLGNALRAYIPETVGFFQNLGSSLGTYDAAGHMVSVTGGLTAAPPASSGRSLSTGSCGPGSLAAPFLRLPGALQCQPWNDYESSFATSGGGR